MFNARNSNAIISKSKNIVSNFFCISEIYTKFWTSWNKSKTHNWCTSEIVECKKRGHLDAYKTPCESTYGQSTCYREQNTAEICTAVVFSNLLITLKELEFEKLCLSVASDILRPVFNILTRNDKYSLSVKVSV